jgi:hypothetical protein
MLSVAFSLVMLSAITPNVIIQSVVMLGVVTTLYFNQGKGKAQ